jgi:IclR family acetate operon transcriptional repressor
MTGSLLDRALGIIELLATEARGLPLSSIAERLDVPKSATHRLLSELVRHGYVRQETMLGHYLLTVKIMTLGYTWFGGSGVADLVQPTLDRLAAATGELVRYAVLDGETLAWIAKAQGARFGLRVDPDMGMEAVLYCTATGHAWLATLDDETALRIVLQQGFDRLPGHGPNAPDSIEALRARLALARAQGYAWVMDSSALGTASIAVAIRHPRHAAASGVVTISGPSVRMTEPQMHMMAPMLMAAAQELQVAALETRPAATDRAAPIGRAGLGLPVVPAEPRILPHSAQPSGVTGRRPA